jgi:hypothetical protein
VACGSGHILLSAARRVALEIARVQTEEEQPNPLAIRKAMKDVIKNCIYGVDKNPLAIELCKISLWLEAYNPGEPLNFLDHHIKCGDAIVGLAHRFELKNGIPDEAFKTLAGDDKDIAKSYRDKNIKERKEREAKILQVKIEFEKSTESSVQEAMAEYKNFNQLPETTPEEIERKAKAYKKFIDGKGFIFLKAMADTQVAQFFIPKTDANKEMLMTDGEFRQILSGYKGWQDRKVAKATAVAFEQRIFHWFIEFPEVFNNGGFDCVLGNPPYLGGKKISGNYGDSYLSYIKFTYSPAEGGVDLVGYFLRRIFLLINKAGYLSLITSQIIKQADTRKSGLKIILNNGGNVCFAKTGIIWPGKAGVIVDLFSIRQGTDSLQKIYLNGKSVVSINDFFQVDTMENEPRVLIENKNNCFQGCVISGSGFMIEDEEFTKRGLSEDIAWPFLIGDEVNNHPSQHPQRRIIYFRDWPLHQAAKYPLELSIVRERVKPERDNVKRDQYRNNWWLFAERSKSAYSKIEGLDSWYVIAKSSKYNHFVIQRDKKTIYDQSLTIITLSNIAILPIIESEIHNSWATKYCSSQGGSNRYNPSDAFHNFPFPIQIERHETSLYILGETYHEHRKQLMLGMQLGLTKTYNLFHSNAITTQSIIDLDKQVSSLQKHLEKTQNTISFNEAIQGIHKLQELHVQMDNAVLDAYGWNDIALNHDFYEVDYLPENDRVRFTIHPDARKEVLKRLLELNHKIHAEEVAAGLWDKKPTTKVKKTTAECLRIGSRKSRI